MNSTKPRPIAKKLDFIVTTPEDFDPLVASQSRASTDTSARQSKGPVNPHPCQKCKARHIKCDISEPHSFKLCRACQKAGYTCCDEVKPPAHPEHSRRQAEEEFFVIPVQTAQPGYSMASADLTLPPYSHHHLSHGNAEYLTDPFLAEFYATLSMN